VPSFEEDGLTHTDSYVRPANFFNNLENARPQPPPYAHAHVTETWETTPTARRLSRRPAGAEDTGVRPCRQLLSPKPNIVLGGQAKKDLFGAGPAVGKTVTIRHTQFTVVAVRGKAREQFDRYLGRQMALRKQRDLDRETLTRAVLTGKITMDEIDQKRVHFLFLQDDVAQAGCGLIHERPPEHLGRSDVGVIAVRKLWLRELRAFANDEPRTAWLYDPSFAPMGEF
jgi:hypothetical protein